jgi:hypothetical protein
VDFSHLIMQTKVSSISLQDNIKLLVTNYVKVHNGEIEINSFVPKSNRSIIDRGKIHTINRHIHDRSIFALFTNISMKKVAGLS